VSSCLTHSAVGLENRRAGPPSRTPVSRTVKHTCVVDEGSTRLTYTGLFGGLEHLKIETRLIDERFPSVMGECVIQFRLLMKGELSMTVVFFICNRIKKAKTEGKQCHTVVVYLHRNKKGRRPKGRKNVTLRY
jgi:hypothetical protein